MDSTQLKLKHVMNMCEAFGEDFPPDCNMVVVCPADPRGSWYILCNTQEVADQILKSPNASLADAPNDEHPVVHLIMPPGPHDENQLVAALEKLGFSHVEVLVQPPWKI